LREHGAGRGDPVTAREWLFTEAAHQWMSAAFTGACGSTPFNGNGFFELKPTGSGGVQWVASYSTWRPPAAAHP